jgi:XTP/dITP diphosphohydrolase
MNALDMRNTLPSKLYIATGNQGKAREIQACFSSLGFGLVVEARAPRNAEETAENYEGNALIKARALQEELGDSSAWVLADDSGLEVNALGGAPGVHTAHYGGMHRLLNALVDVPESNRGARFVAVLVLLAGSAVFTFQGTCDGHIARQPSGEAGFGYDPVFIPEGYEASFAVLGSVIKSKESHRARALNGLIDWIRERSRTASF